MTIELSINGILAAQEVDRERRTPKQITGRVERGAEDVAVLVTPRAKSA
ncbi:MAG: hypothetical protein WAR76_25210 [Xanthobacteraceae bacterium]